MNWNAEKNSLHLWTEHSKNNLAWAFRAHKRFVKSLSPEIQERLAQKDHHEEAYVVVFGQTQVGKTTLLMDLMGVTDQAMLRVSVVLRGGRTHGNSATATAMEYRRSNDDRWGLQLGGPDTVTWHSKDAEITNALGALRTAMERRELQVDAPCVVFIPNNCFTQLGEHQATVRMLDLPGDSPSNLTEQAHVHSMANRYVPLADLILLVGRGDKLEFLQPKKLTLPGIEDWQSVPGRFRIITTYSFTPETVRNTVCKFSGEAEAATYRERLILEIEKFAPLSDDAKNPERYFPLEFGESWSDAKQSEPEIYKKVSPLISKLKKQLLADIQESTTPLARLSSAVNAHIVITRVKENKLLEMEMEAIGLNKEFEKNQNDLNQSLVAVKKKDRECCVFEDRLAKITDENLQHDIDQHYKFIGSIETCDPGETVLGFKACIQAAKSSLKQQLLLSRPDTGNDTAWFWRDIKLDFSKEKSQPIFMFGLHREFNKNRTLDGDVDLILHDVFENFLAHLNNYTLDTYWFTKSNDSDYQKDRQQLNINIQRAKESLTNAARKWWLNAAKTHLKHCRLNQQGLRHEHSILIYLAKEMLSPIVKVKQKIEELSDKRHKFEQRMAVDLRESRRFKALLDEEYLNELHIKRKAILTDDDSSKSFMSLLAAVQLGHIRDKLLNNIKPDPFFEI